MGTFGTETRDFNPRVRALPPPIYHYSASLLSMIIIRNAPEASMQQILALKFPTTSYGTQNNLNWES